MCTRAAPLNSDRAALRSSQNCSVKPGVCTGCNFSPCQNLSSPCIPGAWAQHQCQDVITFAELLNDDNQTATPPRFAHVSRASIVMAPHDNTDDRGVQDPRVAFDSRTGVYYMFYTCFNSDHATSISRGVLCLATSKNPTSPTGWLKRGVVFPGRSKSGALLIREAGPHFLYWGAGKIRFTSSNNLTKWTEGTLFIASTAFEGWAQQNTGVESGPPPMQLSNGNYLFLHNSWSFNRTQYAAAGYQPAWV